MKKIEPISNATGDAAQLVARFHSPLMSFFLRRVHNRDDAEDLTQEALIEAVGTLGELGDRTRDIFLLFRLENMRHREIAALYGITVSTVEKHIAKAVLFLSRKFGPL